MPPFKDLTGARFGRLVVIKRLENNQNNRIRWLCQCDCGRTTEKTGNDLKSGRSRSCGCMRLERPNHYIHGDSHTRLHRIWSLIIDRCKNKNNKNYHNYGGRGITLCAEWHTYLAFKEWALSHGYSSELSIDRIDNNKGYSPGNCRWTDAMTQATNTRAARRVIQCTTDGDFVSTYPTVSSAARAVGKNCSGIIAACKNKQKTSAGFKWRYADEKNTMKGSS